MLTRKRSRSPKPRSRHIKLVKPEKLLALIEEKLQEQSQAEKMTEEKVTEWIKTRVRKLEHEFQEEA